MKDVITILELIAFLLQAVSALGYQQEDITVHRYRQKIYLLEADIQRGAELKGALAQDSVFGFETIGALARRNKAVAAANGMFFDDLGSPAGLLCEGGRWIRISSIGTPCLVIDDQTPSIQELQVKAFWQAGEEGEAVHAFNIGAFHGLSNVFTSDYGRTNRVFRPQVTYRIVQNRVADRYITDMPVDTGDGFLLTFLLPEDSRTEELDWQELPSYIPIFLPGRELTLSFQVSDSMGREIFPENVYQTGGWLVKEGVAAAKEQEEFIGYTTSLQPRTAVGVSEKGKLLLIVADGRQKGVAEGLTGKWLAEVMQKYGAVEAAYLDGGASTMLWLGNGLINCPAYSDALNGKEIAHALLFSRKRYQKNGE